MHPIKTHCKWQNKDIAPTLGKLNSPNHEVYCAVIFVTTINCFIELLCWSKQSKERFTLQRASRFQIESALNVYDFPPSLSLSLPILVFLVTLKPSFSLTSSESPTENKIQVSRSLHTVYWALKHSFLE